MGMDLLYGAGAAAKGVGDLTAGNADAGASNFRAQIARNNATIALRNADASMAAGNIRTEAQGLKTRAAVGGIKAAQAANGVDVNSGSAKDVQQTQSMLGALDALTIRSNAARQAFGFQQEAVSNEAQAKLDKTAAANARATSYVNFGNDLLSTAGSMMKPHLRGTGDDFLSATWD